MTIAEIIVAISLAVAVGLIFYYVFRVTGPWGSLFAFLGILVLAGLAAQAWVLPFGPTIYGAPWLSALVVILLFSLLIAAATPPRSPRERPVVSEAERDITETSTAGVIAFGVFFWLFLIVLFIAVIWGLADAPVYV